MKTYKEGERTHPFIPNLYTRWRVVVSFTLQPIYALRNNCRCPLTRKLDVLIINTDFITADHSTLKPTIPL
jgi:hypothetical protein